MKRVLTNCLALVLLCLCVVPSAFASGGSLSFSHETAIYSISKETFVRKPSPLACVGECGDDEFITLCINIKNTSNSSVSLHNPYVVIDGGQKLGWKDFNLAPGKTIPLHVFHVNAQYLTPGVHNAILYESDKPVYTCRYNIGRDWSDFKMPSAAEIAARPADQRSPYVSSWLQIDRDTRYDAYCVDIKADYLPNATYCCGFNGYMDLSALEKQYKTVKTDGICCYGGLQSWEKGKGTGAILSFWDIYCTDDAGNTTTIRAKRTYPSAETDNDSFGGEGTGAHTLTPYEWKPGQWYRMMFLCKKSETTGNTSVEQWFQDLAAGEWTHICTYDTGVPDSAFIGPAALFLENYLTPYAGEVRSMEFANVRIHTTSDQEWHDVTSVSGIRQSSANPNAYGSWTAGADEHSFYMITTGVSGWGLNEQTGPLSVTNTESGDPLKKVELAAVASSAAQFKDVKSDAYYALPVSWAADKNITSGTGNGNFSPEDVCNQAQILTFLWRAKGEPEPAGTVSGKEYYATAEQWTREQGLIDAQFSPTAPCTRAMAVSYLWKQAGKPASSTKVPFTDVGNDNLASVAWALEAGVTSGTSTTTFSPNETCTRGQIVTFLYRAFAG